MIEVFLSASVPLPSRNRRYFDTADVLAIREAVKALVEVVLPVGRITCGGHPAITPLIALFAEEAGLSSDRVVIYQSAFFLGSFPRDNEFFINLIVVPSVPESREKSLFKMRSEMIQSKTNFHSAVFIGGMEGIHEEARMFSERHPRTRLLPIASTGAAAKEIYEAGHFSEDLATELTYTTLFRRQIRH